MQDNVNVRRHKTLIVYELNEPHKVDSSSTGRRGNIAVDRLNDESIVDCLDEHLVVCDWDAANSRGSPGDRYTHT